jgi:hypothetical protein
MESAYETVLGYWRKANTAIREYVLSRYRAEGDICQVRQERGASTSCTAENRPTVTRSDCLNGKTVMHPSACDLQTCDFRPMTRNFRRGGSPAVAGGLAKLMTSNPLRFFSIGHTVDRRGSSVPSLDNKSIMMILADDAA